MKYLFTFTITPVQSFISQARKTQDLYAGSTLLSDLIGEALAYLQKEKQEGRIKLEYITPKETIDSKPNIFTVEIECTNPKNVGTETEKAVWAYIKEMANTLLPKKNGILPAKSIEQIEDYIKINWVIKQRSESYATDFKEMGALLNAVKNAQKVKQFEERGRKCSLNGEYNVKYYRLNKKEKNLKEPFSTAFLESKFFFEDRILLPYKPDSPIRLKHLQEGEGLSAISLFKRLYKENEVSKFPSVAEIALYDTLDKSACFDVAMGECFEFLSKIKKDSDTEYQLFYEENHTDDNLKGLDKDSFDEAYKKIIQKIKDNALELPRYYAVVMFDADKMGDIISGKFLLNKEQDLRTFQTKVSELLGEYAEWVKKQIIRPIGRVVYAGGDDFLGFLNINHVFPALQSLKEGFDCRVNKELQTWCKSKNIDLDEGFEFSFSAGVVIAHYKTPLGAVLSEVRSTEKTAKNEGDRNAVAITVMKHSGEYHRSYWKWEYQAENKAESDIKTLPLMQELITHLAKGEISDRFLRNLWVQFNNLLDKNGQFFDALDLYKEEIYEQRDNLIKMVELELNRQMLRGKKDLDVVTINKLANKLITPYEQEIKKRQKEREQNKIQNETIELPDMPLTNFLEMLNICTSICKHLNPIQ